MCILFSILGFLILVIVNCVCVLFENKLYLVHESFGLVKCVENAFEWLYGANGVYKVVLMQIHFWLLKYDILILLSLVELMW